MKQEDFSQNEKLNILKSMLILAIPTILEQVLSTLLQYVDTAMVGKFGEQATASVSVTTTITWLVGSLASAIGVAILAMISKAYGKKDEQEIKGISKQVFFLTILFGVLLGIVSIGLSPFIPGWMGAEMGIRKNASIYFAIISIPMIFRVANTVCGSALRAIKDTKTPMLINLMANLLNILLNYIFIYRLQLGVIGAAIGTAISQTISGGLMFLTYRNKQILHWQWKDFSIEKDKLRECAQIGLPVLFTNAASCLGYIVFAGLVSGMGTTTFAAHSIAVTAETIFYIPGYGLRTATSALVGISSGEKNQKKFDIICRLSVCLTMIMMIVNGVILYKAAYTLMGLLTNSEPVILIGSKMLKLVAFSEPFFGLMIVMEGILYGLGRTKYAFLVETFSMWGIRILMTAFCVKLWNMDLQAVWLCMIADNVCKAVFLTIPLCMKKIRI